MPGGIRTRWRSTPFHGALTKEEVAFIERIDCCFPYAETDKAQRLIAEACSLSPNAVFTVLYELACAPATALATQQPRRALLSCVEAQFTHPLLPLLADIARRMIDRDALPVSDAIAAMRAVAAYRNEYAALNIPYMSCDDVNGEADAVYNQVVQAWQLESNSPT